MKKIVLYLFFSAVCSICIAQVKPAPGEENNTATSANNKSKPGDRVSISKDTINIRGIIYGLDGKPAKNIQIGSMINEFYPDGSNSLAKTDSTGHFELKGAKPYDTLRILGFSYNYAPFPNQGSRFMVIYMPPPRVYTVSWTGLIEIKAPRKYPKKIPVFRIAVDRSSIFPIYDVLPELIDGEKTFVDFIQKNLIYPEKAINNNIEGTVQVVFTVNGDGSLGDVRIVKGIGYGCDEQLVELVKKAGRWRPGIINGHLATIQKSVSVKFSLTGN